MELSEPKLNENQLENENNLENDHENNWKKQKEALTEIIHGSHH
jgi:hypothetical protein